MIFREFYEEIYRIEGNLLEGRVLADNPSDTADAVPTPFAQGSLIESGMWYCVRGPPRIKFGKTPYYQSI